MRQSCRLHNYNKPQHLTYIISKTLVHVWNKNMYILPCKSEEDDMNFKINIQPQILFIIIISYSLLLFRYYSTHNYLIQHATFLIITPDIWNSLPVNGLTQSVIWLVITGASDTITRNHVIEWNVMLLVMMISYIEINQLTVTHRVIYTRYNT